MKNDSIDKEKTAITFPRLISQPLRQEIDVSCIEKDEQICFLKEKLRQKDNIIKGYDTLVVLYNEKNEECQLAKLKNEELKGKMDEMMKLLSTKKNIQCTEDGSSSFGHQSKNNSLAFQSGPDIPVKLLEDEKQPLKTELVDNTIDNSTSNATSSNVQQSLNFPPGYRPTRLENDLNLLYEQCSNVESRNDSQLLATKIVNLASHVISLEKSACIQQDCLKEYHQIIINLQDQIYTKDKIIDELKVSGLETKMKIQNSDSSNNYISVISNDFQNEISSCNDSIEVYKQQLAVFKEDFLQERKDRENAHSKITQLNEENDILKKKITELEILIERSFNENKILKNELQNNKVTFHSVITTLKQENQTLMELAKLKGQPPFQRSAQTELIGTEWHCPACTLFNTPSSQSCIACQTSRFSN